MTRRPQENAAEVSLGKEDRGLARAPQLSEQSDTLLASSDRGTALLWLEELIAAGRVRKDRHVVILMKIDQMRRIDENFGYAQGNELLGHFQKRLQVVATDRVAISRISHDEFAILPRQSFESACDASKFATALSQALLNSTLQPLLIGTQVNWIAATLGVAVSKGNTTAERLFQEADIALSYARAEDGVHVQVFTPRMRASALVRSRLDSDLRAAILDRNFLAYAQPQIAFQTVGTRVTGYELLVRWNHAGRGVLGPAEFVGHAEETGLIRQIDLWMLEQACQRLASWAKDPLRAHLRLSINVSTLHFRDPAFADKVAGIIAATGAPARRLALEITETSFLQNIELAKRTMRRLRQIGLRLSLDDFGTGFASMNMLHQLPFHEIKIDRSFVRGLPRDQRAAEIVSNVIQLSRGIGLDVIAEGVETQAQADWLRRNKCQSAQGYLFGQPLPMAG